MVHRARHLGITDDQADQAVAEALALGRIKAAGTPPHSVSLIYGWVELPRR